jgi:hypothetical protein
MTFRLSSYGFCDTIPAGCDWPAIHEMGVFSMQLSESQAELVKRRLLLMQIIAAALLNGAFVFACIVLVITDRDTWGWEPGVLSIVGILFGLGSLVASVVVIKLAFARQFKAIKNDPDEMALDSSKRSQVSGMQWSDKQVHSLMEKYQNLLIIRLAPLEGAIFANTVFFLQEQSYVTLLMSGFLFLVMASLFPTRGKIESFLELRSFIS